MSTLLIGSKFVDGVVPIIDDAKQSIDIVMFYWKVDKTKQTSATMTLTAALARAVARGVRVRMLGANESTRAYLRLLGLEAKELYTDKMVHGKIMCVDGHVCVLGSHNYTEAAFTRNLEVSLLVDLGETGKVYTQWFDALWGL